MAAHVVWMMPNLIRLQLHDIDSYYHVMPLFRGFGPCYLCFHFRTPLPICQRTLFACELWRNRTANTKHNTRIQTFWCNHSALCSSDNNCNENLVMRFTQYQNRRRFIWKMQERTISVLLSNELFLNIVSSRTSLNPCQEKTSVRLSC